MIAGPYQYLNWGTVVKLAEFDLLQYMDLPDLKHLSPEDQQLVIQTQQKVLSEEVKKGFIAIEPFADILDKVGMHNEARQYFQKIIASTSDILTQARCWRKIAFSFINQRDFISGGLAANNAKSLFERLPLDIKEEREEYVKILHASAHSYYFELKFEKLEAAVKEIKKYLPDIADIDLRCNLFHVISMAIYTKYRWYQFPEEAFTHLELQLQLSNELEDKFHHAYTHCIMGHFYLYNEEFALSREHFAIGIEYLEGRHFGQLLMAYNYTAVSYRMQNNIAMTERWATLTLEKAKQTSNFSYVPFSYANLAWVNIKRGNWLYAEENARKAADSWSAQAISCCYAFPLMECLIRKNELDEAGALAYKILHPRLKKLPNGLTEKLRLAVKAWVMGNKQEIITCFNELIDEAKLTGYF